MRPGGAQRRQPLLQARVCPLLVGQAVPGGVIKCVLGSTAPTTAWPEACRHRRRARKTAGCYSCAACHCREGGSLQVRGPFGPVRLVFGGVPDPENSHHNQPEGYATSTWAPCQAGQGWAGLGWGVGQQTPLICLLGFPEPREFASQLSGASTTIERAVQQRGPSVTGRPALSSTTSNAAHGRVES